MISFKNSILALMVMMLTLTFMSCEKESLLPEQDEIVLSEKGDFVNRSGSTVSRPSLAPTTVPNIGDCELSVHKNVSATVRARRDSFVLDVVDFGSTLTVYPLNLPSAYRLNGAQMLIDMREVAVAPTERFIAMPVVITVK